MKFRLSYLLLPLALLLFSCNKEDGSGWDGPVIELHLFTGGEMETKAGADGVKEGVDKYNENLISWVDFFIYPNGDTDSDATFHYRHISGKRRSDVVRIELTSEQVNTLIFPTVPDDIRTATVFAIVNYPDDLVEDENDLSYTSLPELQSRTVTTDFVSPANHRQTRFMMSGQIDITLRGRAQVVAASGTIELSRYASKLTVGVNVANEVTIGYEVWHPMLSGMEIYLVNGVNDVTLGGENTVSPNYFSYRSNPLRFAYTDLQDQIHFYFEKEGDFYATYPTYMYPQKWDYGSSESPRKEPFLKLVVPWQRDADPEHGVLATQKQFYYKIVIPDDRREEFKRSFVRNNWYHIDVNVGILGSETDEALVKVLTGWCYIVYWQDKEVVIKNAEIGMSRYLSVEKNAYTFYNVNNATIPYVSSHPVSIQNVRATRPYYGTSAAGTYTLGGQVKVAGEGDPYPAGDKFLEFSGAASWLSVESGAIRLNHTLVADYTKKNFDYSPYTISYTIVHTDRPDDPVYRKAQTILQYPPIYLEFTPNPDTMHGNIPDHWGYVYVDNDQYTRARYDADQAYAQENDPSYTQKGWEDAHIWRVVHYSGGGRDMYKITATVLPSDSDFIIGDPRQDTIDNLYEFRTAPAIEGGERTLRWYYPTENSDRTVNMIAPSFRISTKHSGTEYGGTGLEQARYRCASFQENGFPAGRWRLPTKAEIRFASQLSANGVFEWQFSSNYWSANGAIYVNKDNGTVEDRPNLNIALIRCVYDSWYWQKKDEEGNYYEDRVDKETFTWADARR